MKKIVVFICLMFITSSAFALSVGQINKMRELSGDNEVIEVGLRQYMSGLWDGILHLVLLSKTNEEKYGLLPNIEPFCVPDNLELNQENLFSIIDDEVKNKNFVADFPIVIPLYSGLTKTFPCEK